MEPTPPPSKIAPIDYQQVFKQAEELFSLERLEEALAQYSIYVNNQPSGLLADKACFRIGDIFLQLGEYQAARESLLSLLEQHPDSSLAADAMIMVLQTYIREDDFEGLDEHLKRTYQTLASAQKPMTASEVAEKMGRSRSTISYHLNRLENLNLLEKFSGTSKENSRNIFFRPKLDLTELKHFEE